MTTRKRKGENDGAEEEGEKDRVTRGYALR